MIGDDSIWDVPEFFYSCLMASTGSAEAALMMWEMMVNMVMIRIRIKGPKKRGASMDILWA